MIEVDFHTHTLYSHCGIHTAQEVLAWARQLGMKGVAITDHGLAAGGRLNSPFFERFICPFPEVKLLKGIECNLLDENGKIDLPSHYIQFLDIVLLGIHSNTPKGLSKEQYTLMLVNAIKSNRQVDLITHANEPNFPVDYEILASEAKKEGVLLELNNSKNLYSRTSNNDTIELLRACKKNECPIAITSDMHAIHELGSDEAVRPILAEVNFPGSLIVNKTAEGAFKFIASRKERKRLY